MPLEWIFGSRKKSEPEQSGQEGSSQSKREEDDEFVMLSQSMPSQSTLDTGGPRLPYSLAPAPTPVVQDSHQQEQSHQQESSHLQQSFLHGVPFKLTCNGSLEDVDSVTTIHVRTTQHLSFIKELMDSNSFEYTFSLEDGVVRQ